MIGFNFVDLIILAVLIYFIWSGYQQGLLSGILNLGKTFISFYISLSFYPQAGVFLESRFHLAKGLGQTLGFVVILVIFEVFLGLILAAIHNTIILILSRIKPLYFLDKILGVIPSFFIGLVLVATATLLPILLPIGAQFKDPVQQSWWGRTVIPRAIAFEPNIESLIQKLPTRNLLYTVTKSPTSDESIPIDKVSKSRLSINERDEATMLTLLNNERNKVGLAPLSLDKNLVKVARAHSFDMFENGYFSHIDLSGKTPADRVTAAGISYQVVGENLAYAPTVEIAHQGLMNSPGHKANILNRQYHKVGIGVVSAGLNGKIFTQNFID